jgi:hypothetical protein
MDGGRRGIYYSNLEFPRSPQNYTPLDVQSSVPRNFFGSVADGWPGSIFLDGRLGRTVGHSTATALVGNPDFAAACGRSRAVTLSYGEEFIQRYTFWKEINRVNPIVTFRTEKVPGKPLTLRFLGSASHPGLPAEVFSYSWTNLVGTARPFIGQGMNFEYTFPVAGEYEIGLGASYAFVGGANYFQKVNVGDQGIVGELFNRSTTQGSTLKQGERADIRLRVENQSDVALSEVRVDSVAVVATDTEGKGAATFAPSAAADARRLTGALDATGGGIRDFADYDLTPTAAGTVRISVNVSGKKPDATPVTAVITWDVTIRPTPLSVELTARVTGGPVRIPGQPLDFVLNENEHKNKFFVDMKFTNNEDKDITQVRFPDPAEPIGLSSRRVDKGGVPIPGVALEPLTKPLPTLNGFTLEAKGTRTLTFEYEGFDTTDAELSARITGVFDGQEISGRGTVNVKVLSNVLVKFGIKLDPDQIPASTSGKTVYLAGRLENVTEDATVGVTIYPQTEDNAGNGNVFAAANAGARTPTSPYGFVLGPGANVSVRALLKTLAVPVASDATVSYVVHAWRHETDPRTGELLKIRAADTQIEILDTDGYSDRVTARLAPADVGPDKDDGCGWGYFGCGVVTGVSNLAEGSYDLVRLAGNLTLQLGNAELRLIGWAGQMLGEASLALQGDREAFKRIQAEIVAETQSLIDAGAITLTKGANLPGMVADSMDEFLRKWDKIYRTGDLEQLKFELGRMAGENPDLVFTAFVAAKAGRKILMGVEGADNVARGAMERAAAKREKGLPERLAKAELSDVPVVKSGAFAAGDPLSLEHIRKYWGASFDDVRNLFKIADAEKVSITFRSRSIEAITLIKNKIAWPKPGAIKFKTINDIDINFLGYRRTRTGRVEIVEPPLDLNIAYLPTNPKPTDVATKAFVAQAESESRAWVAKHHPGLDVDTATKVAKRLQTRIEEWPDALDNFVNKGKKSAPNRTEFQLNVGFDYSGQGIDKSVAQNVQDFRKVRVTEIVDEAGSVRPDPTRRYFELEMAADAKGTGFRGITGDIDFLAILNLDGTFITDQAKRVRIYEAMQKLLGMQHGESFSFIGGGRSDYLNDIEEFVEAGVTVSPGNQAHASHFVKNVSIAIDSPNAGKRLSNPTGDWLLIAGAKYDWRARTNFSATLAIASLSDTLRSFYYLPAFFIPGLLYRFIEDLTEGQTPTNFDGDNGAALRPDGGGGLEQYLRGGSPVPKLKLFGGSTKFADTTPIGRWVPISLVDALALGPDPKKLELVPMTQLPNRALAGETRIEVLGLNQLGMSPNSAFFQPGDEVVIDPGEQNEERALVTALGSLVLEKPLAFDHPEGATVILVARPEASGLLVAPASSTTSPTTSSPPTVSTTQVPNQATLVFPVVDTSSAAGSNSVGGAGSGSVASPSVISTTVLPITVSPAPSLSATVPSAISELLPIAAPNVAPPRLDGVDRSSEPLAYTGTGVQLEVAFGLLIIGLGLILMRRSKRLSVATEQVDSKICQKEKRRGD